MRYSTGTGHSHTAQHSAGDADGSVARRKLTGVSQVHSQNGGIQEMSKNLTVYLSRHLLEGAVEEAVNQTKGVG